MTLITNIKKCIEKSLNENKSKFIIFPFGDVGMQFDYILKNVYNIKADYILDNHLHIYNPNIKPLSFLSEINCNDYVFFLASTNPDIYDNLKESLRKYVSDNNIIELDVFTALKFTTHIGKYSYGPICRDHELIERIGNFCSFATGVDAVPNHEMNYITTHPMIYAGQEYVDTTYEYSECEHAPWYFKGVCPHSIVTKRKRSVIGNDVWLGRNVIITNGANIGNGVIAGAGTIITKDIPDYAVVVGAPARIIRYRYTPEQIEALNRIQWWNWSDNEIRERYDDFYLPIEQFIEKYDF